jgi:hypothetical protein
MSSEPEPGDEAEQPEPPSLWKLFNLPEPRRLDDRDAPEVDRELLRKLVIKELPRDAAAAVYMLIDAFDSWRKAFAELVIEDFHRRFPHGPELSDDG